MTNRRLSALIDALVPGAVGRLSAGPGDIEALRTAIALRAARPGDAQPDEQFVSGLYEELALQARPPLGRAARPAKFSRGRAALRRRRRQRGAGGRDGCRHRGIGPGRASPGGSASPARGRARSCVRPLWRRQATGPWARSSAPMAATPSWVFMNVDVAGFDGRSSACCGTAAVPTWLPASSSCTRRGQVIQDAPG